jgi:hypothetical protein
MLGMFFLGGSARGIFVNMYLRGSHMFEFSTLTVAV